VESRNEALPVTTVTVSRVSNIWKFLPRIIVVKSVTAPIASWYQLCRSSPGRRTSAWWTSALVGTQPMLMHVPPYI
jgi:hypothetical protein